jgi:hypothetical protein
MAETIKIDSPRGSPAEWAALEAIGNLSRELMDTVIAGGNPIIVELKINGVEVSFVKIIERLKDNATRWAYDAGRLLLEERAGVLSDKLRKLQEFADDVEREFKCEASRLFPESHFPGDD